MHDQVKAKALKIYEVGLVLRILAILVAMGLPMLLKGSDNIVKVIQIGLIGEGLATLVMVVALALLVRTPGAERARVAVALILHALVLVVIVIDALWINQIIWKPLWETNWRVVHDRRQLLNLLQYGAAILALIAMLLATSAIARRLGHEMFGDRALGLVKITLGLGLLLGGFWWWTNEPRALVQIYAATLGVRMATTVVIGLYLGVLRQIRRLLVDPEAGATT